MGSIPLVTIGLPVYNRDKFIRRSIDSALAQTFTDFELIISDNASTDKTQEICQEYLLKDRRVRYFRNPENIGLSPNFNRVFALSKSRYFKWWTSDDYWAPTMIEKALEVMERYPSVVLCYPKTTLIDENEQNPEPYEDNLHLVSDSPKERFIQLLEQIRLCHQHTGLIRAEALKRTHMLGDYFGSDRNLLAELTLYGKFYELPEYLFFRRFHPESSSWLRQDAVHQARYYHSKGSAKKAMTRWRQYRAFCAAVYRAPLQTQECLELFGYLGRQMRWDRQGLARELVHKILR